jgi:hypothetical protein
MKKYLYLLLYYISIILGVTILTGIYTTITGQMSMPKETSIVDLNIKPQTIYNKEVNMKVVTLLTGATMTTIGVVNIINDKSFDHKSVRNAVPLDPHRLLVGLGLTTISISIFI